jgi:hypothetical protein
MNSELLKQRFAELANSDQRSKMARFRQAFPAIQAAIEAGVSRAKARDELANLGLDISYKTFTIYLDRVRIERKSASNLPGTIAFDQQEITRSNSVVRTETKTVSADKPARSTVVSGVSELPDDWLTCAPKPGFLELLTPEQKIARTKARDAIFDPSPYDTPLPSKHA